MESILIESSQLFDIACKRSTGIVGKPILQSLREQRREKNLCDVIIQCGNEEIVAHKCVMYAVSKYCRTLFTGSLPATYREGLLIMDLGLFSSDTVEVFIDLVYGEQSSKIREIDVAELLRLGDYLQVSVNILTDSLRNLIDTKNCIKLFESSLLYNCLPLQKILESFICYNLRELFDGNSLNLSDNAVFTLRKNPLYLSQPVELIGADAKKHFENIDFGYRLITYDRFLQAKAESRTYSLINDLEVELTVHKERGRHVHVTIRYFIFQSEFYVIIPDCKESFIIYKYNQERKEFFRKLSPKDCDYSNRSDLVQLPLELPELTVHMVVTSVSEEDVFILFESDAPDLWIMKLRFGRGCKKTIDLEKRITDVYSFDICVCKRSLYLLRSSDYTSYNFDSRSTTMYELHDFLPQLQYPSHRYCAFQNEIYRFTVVSDHSDPNVKVIVSCLNEKDSCWTFASEHIIWFRTVDSWVMSSPNELYLVLVVSDDPCIDDRIYRYDPYSKTLLFWKEVYLSHEEHIFVPDYLNF